MIWSFDCGECQLDGSSAAPIHGATSGEEVRETVSLNDQRIAKYRCHSAHFCFLRLTPTSSTMSTMRPSIPYMMPLLAADECPTDLLASWSDDEIRLLTLLLLTPRASEIDVDIHGCANDQRAQEPFEVKLLTIDSPIAVEDRPVHRAKRPRSSFSSEPPRRQKPRVSTTKSTAGFKTLTSTQCLQHIHKSFQMLTEAKQSLMNRDDDPLAQIKSLNGWQLRCTNPDDAAPSPRPFSVPFYLLSKRCSRHTVQEFMHRTWQLWTDPSALMRMFPSHRIELKVLQRFNGDGLIVRKDWVESGTVWGDQQRSSIYMLFRIETKQGFTLCARSLESSGIEFTPVFHWITFFGEDDTSDVRVEFGSSLSAPPMPLPSQDGNLSHFGLRAALKPAISRDLWALLQWEQLMGEPPRV